MTTKPATGRVWPTSVEWHGSAGYARCGTCGQPVRVNKPILGSLHLCLNACQQARRHLDQRTRRAGPFWRRRTERYCAACLEVEK